MKKYVFIITLLLSAISIAQKPIFTSAKTKGATVYFSGAELIQSSQVNLPSGTSEVVIKNVADHLNENTIQIGAPAHVTVLSVQFTQDFISEFEIDESNPAIKRVKDSIQYLEKEKQKVTNERTSHTKTIELLDKNQQMAGANSSINVAELMKLVDYYNSKRTILSNSVNALVEKESNIQKRIESLRKKLEISTEKQEKASQGKLVLQVMNSTASLVNFDISYITPNASWQPFYDLRTENIASPINLMYKAKVTQSTGIDWNKIKLVLSSGNPNQNNTAPVLSAWFLRYGNLNQVYYQNAPQMNVVQTLKGRVAGIEVDEKKQEESSIDNYTTVTENQLNVSFDIDIPYDILSNGKMHSVALKDLKLPATYKYYAVPKMEKEAFLLAELNDYGKYNLLPGEANIIFEGMNVGKTFINPNQTQDTLNLSMGRDKKIAIKREKVIDKSGTKFLSSYKEQTFTYDITVRNNKKEEINMLLKDQFPLSTDKDITIEYLDKDGAKHNEETGILTWEIKLKPNETKKYRISYKVKYPKDKVIGNL